jgi:regulation of enolase protein 1 (concanavalin A-like superfamily)
METTKQCRGSFQGRSAPKKSKGERDPMHQKRSIAVLFVTVVLALAVALPAAAQLPAGFTAKAVGAGSGSVDVKDGKFTVQGGGADLADTGSDSFFFVANALAGDGNITARLTGATGGAESGEEKVGVMIRETFDPDSAHATIHETNNNFGLNLRWREAKGGDTTREQGYAARTFPIYLRMQRAGNSFTGYYSFDGQTWVPTNTETVTMGANANAGLAVASGDDGVKLTAQFDNVSVNPGQVQVTGLQACGNDKGVLLTWKPLDAAKSYNVYRGAPGIGLSSVKMEQLTKINTDAVAQASFADISDAVQSGARQVYAVAPVLADGKDGPLTLVLGGKGGTPPSPLPNFTVTVFGEHKEGECAQGSVGAFVDPTTNIITIRGGGFDFWSGGESSVFLSQKMSGNFRATVQILGFPLGVNPCCGKAGLFVRESLDPKSRYVGDALRTDGLRQQRRDDAVDTNDSEGSFVLDRDAARAALNKGPIWMRVERKGDEIATLYSLDGTTFQPIDDPFMLPGLAADVQVGLQIGARDRDDPIQNRLSEAQFKDLKIEKL